MRLTARGRGNRERRDPSRLQELLYVCGAFTPDRLQLVSRVVYYFRLGDATSGRRAPIDAQVGERQTLPRQVLLEPLPIERLLRGPVLHALAALPDAPVAVGRRHPP